MEKVPAFKSRNTQEFGLFAFIVTKFKFATTCSMFVKLGLQWLPPSGAGTHRNLGFPPQLPEKCAQATLTPLPASIKPILPQTCHAEIQMFSSIHPLLKLKYLLGFVEARTIQGFSLCLGISTCLICKSIVG